MYLKALEIQGFKSFAEKTVLTFEEGITGIVGPNGSGKSNISDALLWVMGEQRTRTLRGTKMEDVIFGGTLKRSPLGYAQVSLILDNSARIFNYDNDEVVLTRRYYRSGESEYRINRESVRLKDITTMLLDTGLGRDGYSIIGQGRIAEIVSNKSTDRREVFEEAAGIAGFRRRKEEAELRLQRTDENLLRINDKIEELELQVHPLRAQAEAAKKYLVLRDQLRIKEISVWMDGLDRLREQSKPVELEYLQTNEELEGAKARLEALYASSGNITERMHDSDSEAERMRERMMTTEQQAAAVDGEAAVLEANSASAAENAQRIRSELTGQESRAAELEERIQQGEARRAEIAGELEGLRQDSVKTTNVISGCRMKLKSREDALAARSEEASNLAVEGKATDSRIAMLAEMEREFEGYSKAVKTVMREAGRGTLRGIHGPVSNLLRADEECALAIETALGAAGQNIVTDSMDAGRQAIEMLKRMDAGRATFLPLDTIKGSVMTDAPESDPGFVGVAYDLVSFDARYDSIVAYLLGRTVVAETLSDATRISRKSGNRLRIVTLDGQMINAGGSMTGGSSGSKNSGILSRANELEKLKKQRLEISKKEQRCAVELERAKNALAAVRYELELAQEDQTTLAGNISALESEDRTTAGSVAALQELLLGITGDSEMRRRNALNYDSQAEELLQRSGEKRNEAAEIRKKADALREEIRAIMLARDELENKRTKAEKDIQTCNEDIVALERRISRLEQKRAAAEMEEKQLLDALWNNYELSRTAANELRLPVENLREENKAIAALRREMGALGTPNLGAIEEYERVNSRYQFLTEQRDDVKKAKAEITGIITEITTRMEAIFMEAFRDIDRCFRETFLELFGGGKASLVLEDEENVLECGIDVKVQPPGKAVSSISLLSGGEKAFVAIALYFAILKVRPTPFCVMDEIEAALDEENVERYASYMRRMSEKTQFIVITHRRGTMEEADTLYGVTMQEKGVTTVLKLNLAEAEKTIAS